MSFRLVLAFLLLSFLLACDDWSSDFKKRTQFFLKDSTDWILPDLNTPETVSEDVLWYELGDSIQKNSTKKSPERIWMAMPADLNPRGCIIMAPSSMTATLGGELDEEDRRQMILFGRFGFVALGFDVPGILPENATRNEQDSAVHAFLAADGGLARRDLPFAFIKKNLPMVDPKRVWFAGEGLAGTLALLMAEHDPRILGAIAYDPVTDLVGYIKAFPKRLRKDTGLLAFARSNSPQLRVQEIHKPLLLYHDSLTESQFFPKLEDYYLRCLKRQKNVILADSLDGEEDDDVLVLRTGRTVEWLNNHDIFP